jgi:hypothetical protein
LFTPAWLSCTYIGLPFWTATTTTTTTTAAADKMNTLIRNKTTAVQAHALEDGRANPLKPGAKHSSEYFKILEDAEPVACCRQFEFPVNDGIAGGWVAAALSRVSK